MTPWTPTARQELENHLDDLRLSLANSGAVYMFAASTSWAQAGRWPGRSPASLTKARSPLQSLRRPIGSSPFGTGPLSAAS
jgi:hypothetical protein